MNDIKVIEKDLFTFDARHKYPLGFFAEAVDFTRKEPGISIEDIAKCFKYHFDEAELKILVKELQKKP